MANKTVTIETSARHVHLSAADLARLFGEDYALTPRRALNQPGQFLAEERLHVEGPKGALDGVAILGPVRPATQVELSLGDARALGITVPVRASGDVQGSAGVKLVGPKGALVLKEGAIAARRHIHLSPDDAARYALHDGQVVSVRVGGPRALVFDEVVVRVSSAYNTVMHVDVDEANAAGLTGPTEAEILD
ncbi:PduL/EutD family phosphate acyltransferase [Ethanoligenens harbinense]|uniref:Phosphate propanoyltransferase n=1 Tax=Ethanoligenens harbinense (strain DSM 18485 / JCM 12961 / CGMCC 1.5033 / YUAN-3) TaxID=663278 RepID=E6U7T2_ETHHY|nr:phosphate propanoyltransferase [Ethanoligenens harbinense]ADU28205.1 Propanediol utilization protein [Ethanoligenens harbinense YUAN-3]AVQ97203.1 phosphate propanoyltransferase [Ethanoligenens harbinense YUAN-3]AYF39866.1 phosphate propanoyltransferase [Ethanoligenens harbinense]AYF42698.1 phosphate propanoyltransferase [Ethanoligenens harbinense]QCN93449.1 phosphate propanoyltransferase [Ethanoligenens harbinense]